MFTQTFIEALLADPELADTIWQLWIEGGIDDDLATIAWLILAALEFVCWTNAFHAISAASGQYSFCRERFHRLLTVYFDQKQQRPDYARRYILLLLFKNSAPRPGLGSQSA